MVHWESEREAYCETLDPWRGFYSMSHPVGIVLGDARQLASYEQYLERMRDSKFRSRISNALGTPVPRHISTAGLRLSQDWMTMVKLLDTSRRSTQERSAT